MQKRFKKLQWRLVLMLNYNFIINNAFIFLLDPGVSVQAYGAV